MVRKEGKKRAGYRHRPPSTAIGPPACRHYAFSGNPFRQTLLSWPSPAPDGPIEHRTPARGGVNREAEAHHE